MTERAVTPIRPTDDLARLEQYFPSIAWREPIAVTWPDAETFACRVCIAIRGFKRASTWQWREKAEAERHMRRMHMK